MSEGAEEVASPRRCPAPPLVTKNDAEPGNYDELCPGEHGPHARHRGLPGHVAVDRLERHVPLR
jgi:hypothetical protein